MSPAGITLRAAVPRDSDALSVLVYRSKQSNGYDAEMMAQFARSNALKITPERLAVHPFWVAELDRLIVGCIALDPRDGKTGEVRTFFVAPEYIGQGIGRLLWFQLLPMAQTQGFEALSVAADPASVLFYEALGFTTQRMVESGAIKGRMIPYMVLKL